MMVLVLILCLLEVEHHFLEHLFYELIEQILLTKLKY